MFALFLFLSAALILTIIILYGFERRKFKDVEKIPGPPTRFLFGNTLEFGKDLVDVFNNTQRLIKKYGPLVRIWQGPFQLQLLVTGPDYVEHFLTSQTHLKKPKIYNFLLPWMGEGLLTSTGVKWKKHRRIITPAFHAQIHEEFAKNFNRSGRILVQKLKQKAGEKIDIYDYIKLYSFDVLCESCLKICPKTQETTDHSLILATESFMDIFVQRVFSILIRYDVFFRFSSYHRLQDKIVAIYRDFNDKVMQRRKYNRALADDDGDPKIDDFGIKKKKVFIDLLLENKALSKEEIRDEINTLIGTGHESVTTGLSFGLYELAKHSDIQARILNEIHQVIGYGNDSEIMPKHLQEMKYLDCVMKEILRFYPPVALYGRELEADVVLDGIRIPKGTMLTFHPFVHHRNEKYFPDPDRFDPDRFLLGDDVGEKHPFAMIPFSGGPRICIGSKYALIYCKTAIANVVRNFRLIPGELGHQPMLAVATMIKSMNGLPIKLELRE